MEFISDRAKHIFNVESELGRNKQLNATANKNGFSVQYNNQYIQENDGYWVSANVNRSENDGQKSETEIYSIGYSHKIDKKTDIGIITQIDKIFSTNKIQGDNIILSGLGWLVGPYLKTNVAGNIFLNMRAAWGGSKNDFNFNNQEYNKFNTSRFFIKGEINGKTKLGKWTLNPHISGQAISEKQNRIQNTKPK